MSGTILCAIDINRPEEERQVLERAAQMATLDDAQLDVITVVPDFGASMVGAYFQDHDVKTARDTAAKTLATVVEDALGTQANAKVRHVTAVGSVYEEVLKVAKVSQATLIVIGAHRPDLKDYLLGPNAARVVRHAACSVFVVRAP
ncbi:MAG: universal stress protein [Pseudomonadota bacterium]